MVRQYHPLNGHESEQTLGDQWRTEESDVLESMGSQKVKHILSTEQQQQDKVITATTNPHFSQFGSVSDLNLTSEADVEDTVFQNGEELLDKLCILQYILFPKFHSSFIPRKARVYENYAKKKLKGKK